MAENIDDIQTFKLEVENELRILVGEDSTDVTIKLVSGIAEIYGAEMVLNEEYSLSSNSSISIFTWHGCVIKLSGTPEAVYIVSDTAMILNVVLHASLEERRLQAEAENKRGPVTLVVGPTDVGKSTLCRFLLNYAARLGRRPLFIDLDVGQNSISIPGTIGVLTVEKPADIVSGFDDQAVQVYEFGYKSPGHNIILYFLLLKKLGQTLRSGLRQTNQNIRTSGVIINSCGWIRGHGYDAITLVAMNFEIDVLCVLEEERLYLQLQRDMPACVKMIFIPKMDGVVERSRPLRNLTREARVREYFYGSTNQLQPFTFEVNYSDIQVFKVVTRPVTDDDQYLADVIPSDAKLERVPLGYNLVDQVLGLSSTDTFKEDLMLMHVIGFICVTNIDIARNTITVLSPQPSPLPKKILLMGNTRFTEHRGVHFNRT
ncbi:protein CLP1 homolog [Argiope bruennichi]|uniref:Polyribonucleotide 5'-hydroxyl-kinase Clp1 like protein n=1 Tax=Argiope bruennichi TaxID=94029 RepID=A0A8T0E207_ARGBR|nr:protein CLP1 homolog [Argiope bruennichi]KAF8763500.1 Polyribonucleotide 5'-hydroxyl-kinase Clp1 like protein [Argiope bruennichi]